MLRVHLNLCACQKRSICKGILMDVKAVKIPSGRPPRTNRDELRAVLAWYGENIFGRLEGPGVLPFYCDPARVGWFAVGPEELRRGEEGALFQLLVGMAMFQARRDVVIMRQQRQFSPAAVRGLASSSVLEQAIASSRCACLESADAFDKGCDVYKDEGAVDCARRPETRCHVKSATCAFNRMGDMGKVPTSAWLHLQRDGGFKGLVERALERKQPAQRAAFMVESVGRAYRIGRKLATMFVSALSTPALAPDLTPWFPEVDGNTLVVVDTNVARAVSRLSPPGASQSYAAREAWVRERAAKIDLRRFHPDLPKRSPRIVQQALYAFCSRSNRVAQGDKCLRAQGDCDRCAPSVCPFAPGDER